jgi:hypothetical protein
MKIFSYVLYFLSSQEDVACFQHGVCWAYPVITILKGYGAGLFGLCTLVNNNPVQCNGVLCTQFDDIQAPISYISFRLLVFVFIHRLFDNTVLHFRDSVCNK